MLWKIHAIKSFGRFRKTHNLPFILLGWWGTSRNRKRAAPFFQVRRAFYHACILCIQRRAALLDYKGQCLDSSFRRDGEMISIRKKETPDLSSVVNMFMALPFPTAPRENRALLCRVFYWNQIVHSTFIINPLFLCHPSLGHRFHSLCGPRTMLARPRRTTFFPQVCRTRKNPTMTR